MSLFQVAHSHGQTLLHYPPNIHLLKENSNDFDFDFDFESAPNGFKIDEFIHDLCCSHCH